MPSMTKSPVLSSPAVFALGFIFKISVSSAPLAASLIFTAISFAIATFSTTIVELFARLSIFAPAPAPPASVMEPKFAHLVISTAPLRASVIFKFSKFKRESLFVVAVATAEVTTMVSSPAPPSMLWVFAALSISTKSSPPPNFAVAFWTFLSFRLEKPPS